MDVVLIYIFLAANEINEDDKSNFDEPPQNTTGDTATNQAGEEQGTSVEQQYDVHLQVKAILSTLLRQSNNSDRRTSARLRVNNEDREFTLADDVINSNSRRHLFLLNGVKPAELYWYSEYAAMFTSKQMLLSMCAMSNGDVMLSVYMTR
jgi:hypothetical protein